MPIDETVIALPADLAELRRGQIKAHGVMVLDVVLGQGTCTKCGAPVGLALGANMACGFRSVEELVKTGAKLAAGMSRQGKGAPCRACGGPAKVVWAQYHAFHSGLGVVQFGKIFRSNRSPLAGTIVCCVSPLGSFSLTPDDTPPQQSSRRGWLA
jgi:hypothetical protein